METAVRVLSVLLLSSVITVSGCAAVRHAQPSFKVVASSSESQPKWLATKASEDAGYLFFVGRADGVQDLSRSEDQAQAHALTLIRGALRESLLREFEAGPGMKAAGKRDQLDRALSQGLSEIALDGVAPVERYWERGEVSVADGTVYAYRVALLVRIPKSQFEATRAQAYKVLADQVGLETVSHY